MELNFEITYRIHIAAKKWSEKSFNRSDPFAYERKKLELQSQFANCSYKEAVDELIAVEKLCAQKEQKEAA